MRSNCAPEEMCRFTVIGIDDNPGSVERNLHFVKEKLQNGKVFSGGKRHYELVRDYLPDNHTWIDIIVPLNAVFDEYSKILEQGEAEEIIVFASGDPLFYGFAVTIMKRMPQAHVDVYPVFNSLQNLAHRLVMQYDDMETVSLTGRPWHNLDRALIERKGKIGVLTDKVHNPQSIAARLLEYGFSNYIVHVGECLGGEREKISTITLEEAASGEFMMPNCVILQMEETGHRRHMRRFGIPHQEFSLLDGRENMITKMPIRLMSLSMLDLYNRKALWDIGFCTGSVSIEAKMQFPHLHIDSFEIREQCASIMEENCRKFGTPGINHHIADFTTLNLQQMLDKGELHYPDAIFIGGHGGKMAGIMQMLSKVTEKGCVVVFNSVKDSAEFEKAALENGFGPAEKTEMTIDNYNRITCCKVIRR